MIVFEGYYKCTCSDGTSTTWRKGCPVHDPEVIAVLKTCDNCNTLRSRIAELEAERDRLRAANEILWDASFQSHTGHWDSQGTHGANCPECIRARELREKSKAALRREGSDG